MSSLRQRLPVVCPHCDHEYGVDAALEGQSVRCPECRERFTADEDAETPGGPRRLSHPQRGALQGMSLVRTIVWGIYLTILLICIFANMVFVKGGADQVNAKMDLAATSFVWLAAAIAVDRLTRR